MGIEWTPTEDGGAGMNIMVDYALAKECKNPDALYMCHKCGECGRKFEDGFMVDDGGTHPQEDEE